MDVTDSSPHASPFSSVRSTRAHEQIVVQLQQLILSGKLAPGSRLPSERALMAEFQVSRPTVREALRVTESMGLISVRPGDPGGPKVLGTPSIGITRVLDSLLLSGCTSALELMELRVVLDSSAAALASMQPKARLKDLSDLLQKMQFTTDLHTFAELDANFHEGIIVASGNRLFHLVFQALDGPIRSMIEASFKSAPQQSRADAMVHHAAILDAIQSGDPARAAAAVRAHLRETCLCALPTHDKAHVKSFLQAMDQ